MTELTQQDIARHAWIWAAMLGVTTLSGTIIFACMMPFVAVATVTALSLPRTVGLSALSACWLGNQILGFGLLGYPWDGPTFAAGISLLVASVAAFFVAKPIAKDMSGLRPFVAAVLAFAAFECVLAAYAFAQGDMAMFTFEIILLIGTNDLVWFIALWSAWHALALFVPDWRSDTRNLAQ